MAAYPETAGFLSEEEKRVVLLANEADRAQKASEHFNGKQIRSAFTDWRTWLWGLVYISIYIPVYSVILSLPSVVTGLGYKGTQATLMACPPYGLGFIIVLLAGWTMDRYGRLFYHYVAAVVVVIVALIVLMTVENLVVRYIMFFFVMFMYVTALGLGFPLLFVDALTMSDFQVHPCLRLLDVARQQCREL